MGRQTPNVLLIMADSMIQDFVGVYGDPAACTPNLDALAAGGTTFRRAWCNSPLCTPSRASMMTGRYVSDIGALDNANMFSSEIPTLAHVFKARGYPAALVGKMHFIGHDQTHGFDAHLANQADYSLGYDPNGFILAYDWEQPSGPNPTGSDWMGQSYVNQPQWDHYPHHYDADNVIHKAAMEYLSELDVRSPFFTCVSYHHPHNPFWIPDGDKARFKNVRLPIPDIPAGMDRRYGVMERWLNDFHSQTELFDQIRQPENLRWLYETYYGMVYDLDRHVGELLSLLRSKGLDRNTVVIFTADHGEMLGHRGMIQKRCLYERSVRVPLIFRAPGRFVAGRMLDTATSLVDLLPTLADLMGVDPPEGLPGQSLLPTLESGTEDRTKMPERVIFSEYHGEGVHAPCFMAVRGPYKFIYVHGHEEKLYHLPSDPDETNDLIASDNPAHAAAANELKAAVLSQFDPDRIAASALASQKNRRYIYRAHNRNH